MASDHESVSLGTLGQYYSARHALGQYRSACVVASYSALEAGDRGPSPPALRCLHFALEQGIPLFKRLHCINRRDVPEIIDSRNIFANSGMKEATSDALLSRVLGARHAELWPTNKPAWRVIVIEHTESLQGRANLKRLDIAFFAHHAIVDGLSGVSFHASLMEAFRDMSELTYPPTWPMALNAGRDAPAAVEERVDCPPSGNKISPAPLRDYKSMVHLVSIPEEKLSTVLKRCRACKITLTGLLHAMICTSLYRGVKDLPGIRTVTPFSVRKQTRASDREIVNHISFLATYISGTDLSKAGQSKPGSAAEEEHMIQLARSFSHDIATKVKQFPHGGMFGHLNSVENLLQLCQSQGGTERLYTYELSNLGSVSSIPAQPRAHLKLEKLAFTQCGMVAGPAISINCASVRGGCFTISITWEQGVVAESLVEHLAGDLELWLNHGVDACS